MSCMSDSWIAFQPAIDDPSNMMPSANVSSSTVVTSPGDVLPFAARIGKAEIDVFHVVVLDHLHHVLRRSHGRRTLSWCWSILLLLFRPTAAGSARAQRGAAVQMASSPDSPRPDPDGFFDVRDEDLPVADPPGLGIAPDRLDRFFNHVVTKHNLDFHLGEKIDDIFGAAVEFGVSLLRAQTPWLR